MDRISTSYQVGGHFDRTTNYSCGKCSLTDILCNGASVLAEGRVVIVPGSNMISFNFPRFDNAHACVFMGFFRLKNKVYKKVLAVIETVVIPQVPIVNSPKQGEQFEQIIQFSCEDCTVKKVFVNGVPLESNRSGRRSSAGSIAFFEATSSEIIIRVTEFSDTFEGVYQAEFMVSSGTITKTIMEIRDPSAATEASRASTPAVKPTTPGGAGSKNGTSAAGTTVKGVTGASTASGTNAAATTAAPA